ncbi:hypothetical protein UB46_10860 [Burkholderiaceae bacterium 16]|nr:hypothetical protein UB46_10860 [Burkholderiaceae bacterium 16]
MSRFARSLLRFFHIAVLVERVVVFARAEHYKEMVFLRSVLGLASDTRVREGVPGGRLVTGKLIKRGTRANIKASKQ